MPFVPGYEIAGVVDAIGADVQDFRIGQRVAALTLHGGFAEYMVRDAEHFIPIPDGVSDVQAAATVLNYVTAWQMIHRVARVRCGQTALVTGAAGGVGTAALQLLRLAGGEGLRRGIAGEARRDPQIRCDADRLPRGPFGSPGASLRATWRRCRFRRRRRIVRDAMHQIIARRRHAGRLRLHERRKQAGDAGEHCQYTAEARASAAGAAPSTASPCFIAKTQSRCARTCRRSLR